MLQNPSFECSEQGWTLDEIEVVWGSVPDPTAPPSKKKRRDISSSDSAYDGKGFARFAPTFEDMTATLSQTLSAPAPNGSYWYSFAYRVPASSGKVADCTLTVANDEGTLATISSLSSASSWTMTGKEFTITEAASTFSFVVQLRGLLIFGANARYRQYPHGLEQRELVRTTCECQLRVTAIEPDLAGIRIELPSRTDQQCNRELLLRSADLDIIRSSR